MKVLVDRPINVDEVEFQPRGVSQTTLYPLDREMSCILLGLQRAYEKEFNTVYMFDQEKFDQEKRSFIVPGPWTLLSQVSFDRDIKEGRIRLFNDSPKGRRRATKISKDAGQVYKILQDCLKPYTEGMEPKDKYTTPELNWGYKVGDTLYKLKVEFSDDRKWLIASPKITLDIVGGKTRYDNSGRPLSHHVQGPFEDEKEKYEDFERVFHAMLSGSDIAEGRPRFLRMDYGILEVGVRPIPAFECLDRITGIDVLFHRVLENKDLVYEAVKDVRGRPNLQRAGELIRQIPRLSPRILENYLIYG